jgi:hypothetical protein
VSILAITIAVSAVVLVSRTNASSNQLSLPSSLVTIEACNSTQAYFDIILTNVPDGFEVFNGTYLGWCIDCSIEMQRSPATHQVILYSSLGSKPGNLQNQKWDMVNYILNNKQGDPLDVQQAIWHFINLVGGYSAEKPLAEAMIEDAVANGAGFIPNATQTVAVICYPMVMEGEEDVQMTIIEMTPERIVTPPTTSPPEQTPEILPTTEPDAETTTEDSGENGVWLGVVVLAAVALISVVWIVKVLRKRGKQSDRMNNP